MDESKKELFDEIAANLVLVKPTAIQRHSDVMLCKMIDVRRAKIEKLQKEIDKIQHERSMRYQEHMRQMERDGELCR